MGGGWIKKGQKKKKEKMQNIFVSQEQGRTFQSTNKAETQVIFKASRGCRERIVEGQD